MQTLFSSHALLRRNILNKLGLQELGNRHTFYCFSPPVMLATMAIEVCLALYTILRFRHGLFAKLVVLTLLLLAFFQLAEYEICADSGTLVWSRLGLIAITFLPAVGLHMVAVVSKKRIYLSFGYVFATALSLFFAFGPASGIGSFCGGNYIIFNWPREIFIFYAIYYGGFLTLAIWKSLVALNLSHSKRVHNTLKWLMIGYSTFMVPVGIVYAFYAPARMAVASIMCGFAVTLAFILTFMVVPNYYKYSYPAK